MSLVLNESVVLAKTRSQDLKSVLKLNCWGCGIKDVSLVRRLVNVEVIGLSCNEITTLEDFAYCKKLKELILRGNQIKNISEVAHLQKLPHLTNLWLQDNPCAESTYNYRKVVLKALPDLKVLDNQPVTREELQEIEELGNEIYEEIPYESGSSSHSSGPPSHTGSGGGGGQAASRLPTGHQVTATSCNQAPLRQTSQPSVESSQADVSSAQIQMNQQPNELQHLQANQQQCDQSLNEMNVYQPAQTLADMSETVVSNHSYAMNDSASMAVASRSPRLQGSLNNGAGNHQQFGSAWSSGTNINLSASSNNNNNNNNNSISSILPKGGKNRNANILSAVLCLVKELDYVSCEVVKTALHCRMEETS